MQLLKLAAGAAALLLAGQAHAATWLVNYTATSGDPLNANLTLTASDTLNAVNGYDVTGVSGDVAGDLISGLVPNLNQPYFSYSDDGLYIFDNVVSAGAPNLSWYGLLFRGSTGVEYNLFSTSPSSFQLSAAQDGHYVANSYGTLAVTNGVPEPAAWTMMIVGFGGIGAMMRRRRMALATA
jgi:hypothetical protein